MTQHPAAGVRILVLEDNFVVALELASRLERLGAVVDGPHAAVADAEAACRAEWPGVAILDARVRDGLSLAFGQALSQRGIPVVFITGYSQLPALPVELSDAVRLLKPISAPQLDEALRICLERAAR